MKPNEALNLLRIQLMQTEQNKQAFEVLQKLVDYNEQVANTHHIDDERTCARYEVLDDIEENKED